MDGCCVRAPVSPSLIFEQQHIIHSSSGMWHVAPPSPLVACGSSLLWHVACASEATGRLREVLEETFENLVHWGGGGSSLSFHAIVYQVYSIIILAIRQCVA